MEKKLARLRRARRARAKIRELGVPRLSVHRTPRHIYASVIVNDGTSCKTVAAASTLDSELRSKLAGTKSDHAKQIGTAIAERAKKAGYDVVAFDRSGFRFHGRIKSLAEAAREAGLKF